MEQNFDWDELGRNIQNVVDRAIGSSDYQKLNQTVRQVVDAGTDILRGATRTGPSGEGARRTGPNIPKVRYSAPEVQPEKQQLQLYRNAGGKQVLQLIKAISGGFLSFFFAVMSIGGIVAALMGKGLAGIAVFASLLAPSVWLTASGIGGFNMLRRYGIYRRTLGEQTHCKVLKLARAAGKEEGFVRKELQKLIRQGYFLEGHLDQEGKHLITSDETFRYYEQSRLALEQRQRLEAARTQLQPQSRNAQVEELLEKGNAFLEQLRKCDDAIADEEISEKIRRMVELVHRIFRRAEEQPQVIPELKKLMNYYLPMTVKLLQAYAQMDDLPVRSETAEASMAEIAGTLDTLLLAYGRLLDDLFRDTAMDVSSDISVLQTLLAQEGLTGGDFTQTKAEDKGE